MTVVCYRDGIMASDSWVTCNGVVHGTVRKLSVAPNGSIAMTSGRNSVCARFHAWVESGLSSSFEPKCDSGDFLGHIVYPNREIWIMAPDGGLSRVEAEFIADGAGCEIAVGAMAMGATAQQAVEIAIKHNCYCGGDIQTVSLPDAERRKMARNLAWMR